MHFLLYKCKEMDGVKQIVEGVQRVEEDIDTIMTEVKETTGKVKRFIVEGNNAIDEIKNLNTTIDTAKKVGMGVAIVIGVCMIIITIAVVRGQRCRQKEYTPPSGVF